MTTIKTSTSYLLDDKEKLEEDALQEIICKVSRIFSLPHGKRHPASWKRLSVSCASLHSHPGRPLCATLKSPWRPPFSLLSSDTKDFQASLKNHQTLTQSHAHDITNCRLSLSLRASLLCFQNLPRMARCNCIEALLYIYATAKIRFKSQPCSRIRFNNFIIQRRQKTSINSEYLTHLRREILSLPPDSTQVPMLFMNPETLNGVSSVSQALISGGRSTVGDCAGTNINTDSDTMLVMQPLNPKFSSKVYLRWLCKY